MKKQILKEIPEELLKDLQNEVFAIVTTHDVVNDEIDVNAVSWIYAPDSKRVNIGVGSESKMVSNVNNGSPLSIAIITNGSAYSIEGDAEVTIKKLDEVPFGVSKIEVDVTEVKDVMYTGSKIVSGVKTQKTYSEEKAKQLDNSVMMHLKK